MDRRRLVVCLCGGILAAIICVTGAHLRGALTHVSKGVLTASIANRLLLGFVIAISHWRLHYLLHGGILGLLVSLVTSLGFVGTNMVNFISYTAAGIVYGVMIEFLATVAFKAPARCASHSI